MSSSVVVAGLCSIVALMACGGASSNVTSAPASNTSASAPADDSSWTRTAIPHTRFSVEGPQAFVFQEQPAPGFEGVTMDFGELSVPGGRLVIMSRPAASWEHGSVDELVEGEASVLLMPLVERHEEIVELFVERTAPPSTPAVRIGVYRKQAQEVRALFSIVDADRFVRLFVTFDSPKAALPATASRFLDSLR